MDDLRRARTQWEGLARVDPLWAALTDPARAGGRWDPDAFLATGRAEIATVFAHLDRLGLAPDAAGTALDFGCGPGRLTQALAGRFAGAVGVDVSPTMVATAEGLCRAGAACRFVVNDAADLGRFEDGAFAFVYSSVVLQHLAPALALGYVGEFVRVVRPGGVVVFGVADAHVGRPPSVADRLRRLRAALGLRTRLRRLVGAPGGGPAAPPGFEMNAVPEPAVRTAVTAAGGRVVDVRRTNAPEADFNGRLRYLDGPSEGDWVGKQYVVVRG